MVTYKDREYDLVVTIEDNVIESLKSLQLMLIQMRQEVFLPEDIYLITVLTLNV